MWRIARVPSVSRSDNNPGSAMFLSPTWSDVDKLNKKQTDELLVYYKQKAKSYYFVVVLLFSSANRGFLQLTNCVHMDG